MRQDSNPGTMHHKVIRIDDRIVVTRSLNFSASAVEGNDEKVVIIANEALASLYRQELKRRWREGNEPDPIAVDCPGQAASWPPSCVEATLTSIWRVVLCVN
ncbi:MAG: phospholipase D-like domain-containing protein, partial [Candidatus Promineifilaceae bacterium]|nr:phospholipase D-like domain-containing protein [Candidatus Promineifilaceae bacterium]